MFGLGKSATVKIDGIEKVNKRLAELPQKLEKKGIRKGLRAGAKVVHADVRRRVPRSPRSSGRLGKSFKVRSAGRLKKRRGEWIAGVSVTNPEGHLFKGDEFYGGFLELGTKERRTRSGAGSPRCRTPRSR